MERRMAVIDRRVRTTCGYCSVGCGMYIGVSVGRAVAVEGDPDHPVNRGRLCPKGLSQHQAIHSSERLRQPVVDGRIVSWDAAIDRMIGGFADLTDRFGPDAIAVISTGQLVTEEFYTLGKLVRAGMGVRHYDGNTTLCMASAVSGYKRSFGSDGPPGAYVDFEDSDLIVLVGANVADNHPLLTPRVIDNHRASLIVVDPRVTKTAMLADVHVALRPRSDIAFFNGVLQVLIHEGMIDHAYVEAHTSGYDELCAHVAAWTPDRAAAESGVPADMVVHVARCIGRASRVLLAWTMGVNHSVQGAETVTLLNTIALVTGNIGRAGAAPLSITGQCNAMGTREAGSTATAPGYRPWDDVSARAEIATRWNVPLDALPNERGRAYPDIIDGVLDGTIRGLWIVGTNPIVSFPDRARLEDAFDRLELLVVQDIFPTPTSMRAHVVLPAAMWGEKDGTYTNSERRVSRVRKAVDPPGEAKADFDIFLAIAERVGCRDTLFAGWREPDDAFREWKAVSAGRLCDYSGVTYEMLDEFGGVQWPCADGSDAVALGGTPRLYGDGVFPTTDGRARLWCVEPEALREPPCPEYPFVLNTGRTVEHWHTRTKTGRIGILERLAGDAWIELSPADANALHVRSGEPLSVISRRGRIDGVTARVTSTVREGEVFLPFHFDEWCANRLTRAEFDPISREPNYKQCAVRLERGAERMPTNEQDIPGQQSRNTSV
jgi:assimilatory nitrate reductase catalytic subunit